MSGLLGGGSTTQQTEPSQLDYVNADIVNTLAPYLLRGVVADLGGAPTANKSESINQAVAQGAAQGASPGTAQMFSNINKGNAPAKAIGSNTMQMAQMLYGKQPQAMPGGGSTTTTPGMTDYANTAANLYMLFNAFGGGGGGYSATGGKSPAY